MPGIPVNGLRLTVATPSWFAPLEERYCPDFGRPAIHPEKKDITAYIPIRPIQETNMVSKGEFVYHGDHLICPRGKVLRRSAFMRRDRAYRYVAHQEDCQACPIKTQWLPPNQKRRYLAPACTTHCYSGRESAIRPRHTAGGEGGGKPSLKVHSPRWAV